VDGERCVRQQTLDLNDYSHVYEEWEDNNLPAISFLKFEFERREYVINSKCFVYYDQLCDAGLKHYGVISIRIQLDINPLEAPIQTLREAVDSCRMVEPDSLPTFTKFMYIMQCGKATYQAYKDYFESQDPAADRIEKNEETIKAKQREGSVGAFSTYIFSIHDILFRYKYCFTKTKMTDEEIVEMADKRWKELQAEEEDGGFELYDDDEEI
jgi:hypothetical protein